MTLDTQRWAEAGCAESSMSFQESQTRSLLQLAPSLVRPTRAARIDFEGKPYITHCKSIASTSKVVIGSDDGLVSLLDTEHGIEGKWSWKESGGKVTDLKSRQNGWVASGEKGIVGVWDGRALAPTQVLQGESQSLFNVAFFEELTRTPLSALIQLLIRRPIWRSPRNRTAGTF